MKSYDEVDLKRLARITEKHRVKRAVDSSIGRLDCYAGFCDRFLRSNKIKVYAVF